MPPNPNQPPRPSNMPPNPNQPPRPSNMPPNPNQPPRPSNMPPNPNQPPRPSNMPPNPNQTTSNYPSQNISKEYQEVLDRSKWGPKDTVGMVDYTSFFQQSQTNSIPQEQTGYMGADGYYWLEWPAGSNKWYHRTQTNQDWIPLVNSPSAELSGVVGQDGYEWIVHSDGTNWYRTAYQKGEWSKWGND